MHEAETGSHRKDNLTNRPPYFDVDFCGNRYNIIGGAARPVFGGTQTTLQERCVALGEGAVGFWLQEPAHPPRTEAVATEVVCGQPVQHSRARARRDFPDDMEIREAADDWVWDAVGAAAARVPFDRSRCIFERSRPPQLFCGLQQPSTLSQAVHKLKSILRSSTFYDIF